MKSLVSTLFAGILVLAAASVVSAGMMGSGYHGLASIDPSGQAVVSVHSPSSPITSASSERIYLDSAGKWAVNDVRTITYAKAMTAGTGASGLYCFDSVDKFCARAF